MRNNSYEKIITLKEPLVYRSDLQSNKILASYALKTEYDVKANQLLGLTVLFEEPYQKVAKKLPVKLKIIEEGGVDLTKLVNRKCRIMLSSNEDSGIKELRSTLWRESD